MGKVLEYAFYLARWLMLFGLVWLMAWLFNPALTSGTVSFIGAVAALVVSWTSDAVERR